MDPMSDEFFAQPEKPLGDESHQLIYAEVVSRLREENPQGDTLELMLIERIAFLYVYIRVKEATGSFAHDRSYKETNALLIDLMRDLRKTKSSAVQAEEIRDAIIETVHEALAVSIKKLPGDLSKDFQEALANEFEVRNL